MLRRRRRRYGRAAFIPLTPRRQSSALALAQLERIRAACYLYTRSRTDIYATPDYTLRGSGVSSDVHPLRVAQ